MIDISSLTIKKAHEHLVAGDFSVKELVESYVKTAQTKNKDLNAFLEFYKNIDEQIDRAQDIIDSQKENADILAGIPVALKDNILVKGEKVSCASKILDGYTATYDAHVTSELKNKGAILLGRTNMDEFAMGSSTENSAFGVTRNPHDTERVPGGTSGGSAVAVAMEGALGSYGSDTGGSIRQPASFCGVVGLKPTYGSVSRRGLVAYASSFDQIGPFAKTCEDARILFNAVSSHDAKDSTSQDASAQEKVKQKETPQKIIGVPYHLFEENEGIDDDVIENFKASLSLFEKEGYEIRSIELPHMKYALPAYYIICPAEASSNLARFDGVRFGLHKDGKDMFSDYDTTRGEGFGKEVRRRILLGTYVLSAGYYDAYYNKAIALREKIKKELHDAFKEVTVIMTPTAPTPAFKIGEKTKDPLSMYLSDIFTVGANIAGIPAVSVPSGFVEREGKNLPVSLQIWGSHFKEDLILDIGEEFERLRS